MNRVHCAHIALCMIVAGASVRCSSDDAPAGAGQGGALADAAQDVGSAEAGSISSGGGTDASAAGAGGTTADGAAGADSSFDGAPGTAGASAGGSTAEGGGVGGDAATGGASGGDLEGGADSNAEASSQECVPANCPSGVCLVNRGGCAPPCSPEAGTCATGSICCTTACIDVTKDPAHCGACGISCTASQFCTSTVCATTSLANVCATPKVVALLDDWDADNQAARMMVQGLTNHCAQDAGVQFLTLEKAEAGAVPGMLEATSDSTEKRPSIGPGTMLVLAGGGWEQGQSAVRYLASKSVSPLYVGVPTGRQNPWIIQRGTGGAADTPLVEYTEPGINQHHDYFVLEMVVEPVSGTTSIIAYGFLGTGTIAAGWYFANRVAPRLSEHAKPWYVYEWTDVAPDGGTPNGAPDDDDTFRLVSSAP